MIAIAILFRLLLAHFLGDFLFQRSAWVKAKEAHKWRAAGMYYHLLTIAVLTFLLQWNPSKWYVAAIIVITHLAIDIWKSYRPANTVYFLLDQALHICVIIIVWMLFYEDCNAITSILSSTLMSANIWVLALGYCIVIWPLGIAIGKATVSWQKDAGMDTGGLSKAGLWIGRCERVLVLTFIVLGQYTALGFLMTAKSILRFGDSEDRQQKKTEYILVGTLLSFASAAVVGALLNLVLTK